MKQAKFFILIFGFVIALIVNSCGTNGVVTPDAGQSLIDTTLDVSTKDVTLKLNNKIEILFPKGSVVTGTNLKITENPSISVMSTLEYKILKVYNVTLSNNAKLLKPITVTFSYDQAKIDSGVFANDLKAAYFEDGQGKWSFYQSTLVDSVKKTISFVTSHLTPLGFAEFISSGGYQQKFVSTHFQVYYTNASANKVMSNDTYGTGDQPWRIKSGVNSSTPFYVQDLSHWLEEAFVRYQNFYKFELPKDTNCKINVYIKAIVGADGEYGSITGVIYVNNNMVKLDDVQDLSYPELLKSVAAHELMHYVQDNYYVMNNANLTIWWLEATASNADYMVWGTQLKHSESYCWSVNMNKANGSVLAYNISRSWDNCAGSPFHYAAGCFLSYLTNYSNINFNLSNLIKVAGNTLDLSYIRTILDNNLRTSYSTNIGEQFDKYVNWLFVRSNSMSLKYSTYSVIPNPDNAFEFPMILDKNNKKSTYDKSLPYLSANAIKIKLTDDLLRTVRVKAVSIPSDIYVYLYNSGTTNTLEKELKNGDSIDITIPIKQIKDIVVINRSKDNNLKPTITIELVETAVKSKIETVLIPTGSFKMGEGSSENVHTVSITKPFYISKYEITNKQYNDILPGLYPPNEYPVETCTWVEAVTFCNEASKKEGLEQCYTISGSNYTCNFDKKGYRLPTEAEWEYACKGTGTLDGIAENKLLPYAWNNMNSGGTVHQIGQKTTTDYGLFDMLGNVSEWCWDWYAAYGTISVTNPTGPSTGSYRVLRGGNYNNPWSYCTYYFRQYALADDYSTPRGIRVVLTK